MGAPAVQGRGGSTLLQSRTFRIITLLVASGASFIPSVLAAQSQQPREMYAQRLTEQTVQSHPGMLDLIFHVTPPNSEQNIAIAAYTDKERNQKSGDDDLGVITSGKPLVEVQKDGVRIGVVVPLKDRAGTTVGALGVVYAYKTNDDQQLYLHRAEHLRDQLAKKIASRAELFKIES